MLLVWPQQSLRRTNLKEENCVKSYVILPPLLISYESKLMFLLRAGAVDWPIAAFILKIIATKIYCWCLVKSFVYLDVFANWSTSKFIVYSFHGFSFHVFLSYVIYLISLFSFFFLFAECLATRWADEWFITSAVWVHSWLFKLPSL